MSQVYLNKNTKFICDQGIGMLVFEPVMGDLRADIKGSAALLDNCTLKIATIGMCMRCPTPSGTYMPCSAAVIPGVGLWKNSTNVSVSGFKILGINCSIMCPLFGGKITPVKTTYDLIDVNDDVTDVKSNFVDCIARDKPEIYGISITDDPVECLREKNRNFCAKRKQSEIKDDALLCSYKSDNEKCKSCKYRQTICDIMEGYEGSATILKCNMERSEADTYDNEIEKIKDKPCDWIIKNDRENFSSCYIVNHHHIIPANQCFYEHLGDNTLKHKGLVKLANFYDYDINEADNGICLPTMNKGYSLLSEEDTEDRDYDDDDETVDTALLKRKDLERKWNIAHEGMEKFHKQWHKGGHKINANIMKQVNNALGVEMRPLRSYAVLISERLTYLEKHQNSNSCRLDKVNGTEPDNAKQKKFISGMRRICEDVRNDFKNFGESKHNRYLVSKWALFYSYYDILKSHEEIFFGEKTEEE